MEEKLRDASREELLQHVLTQRILIRHLYRRIVNLEDELSNVRSTVTCRSPTAAAEAAEVVVAVTSPSPPRDNLPEGIAAIDRLVKAHLAGESFLQPEVAAELIYIQRELKNGDTTKKETVLCDNSSLFQTPIQKGKRVSITPSIINKGPMFTLTPQQQQQSHHQRERQRDISPS
ncbi:uncharacterized protein TM35_000142680 [Trypanosoma theileri]|uniref:Uncharacterized protein n=1 Tax=Trypanosoma theileri TaxID=67003 RepID=A0A1X0NWH9_9TRYP|nr:uncharacterized protein TM35_000142680 [Trypanosoma theileri]ORC89057.1 hypothetical protein TM35_000142680 [Trypanosoma theileri]